MIMNRINGISVGETTTTYSSKSVVLSMDIEDWYHLEYFDRHICDKHYSLLDGINVYLEILKNHNIQSSFFVLGEIADLISSTLNEISKENHDIGSHGWSHTLPSTLDSSDFIYDLERTKNTIENIINCSVEGYRAPCFSIDRKKLDQVQKAGFSYDSSRIDFHSHPLYETINMDGFEHVMPNIYRQNDFFEFEVSTNLVYGRNIPISGGGYLRLLPWYLSQRLIESYLSRGEIYILYIHPFELSLRPNPYFPPSTKWYNKLRFGVGRSTVSGKLSKLIDLLKENGYRFTTFSSLRNEILKNFA